MPVHRVAGSRLHPARASAALRLRRLICRRSPACSSFCRSALRALTSAGCVVDEVHLGFLDGRVWRSWPCSAPTEVGSILTEPYADPPQRARMKSGGVLGARARPSSPPTNSPTRRSSAPLVPVRRCVRPVREFFDSCSCPRHSGSVLMPSYPCPREIAGRQWTTITPLDGRSRADHHVLCPALNCARRVQRPPGLPLGIPAVGGRRPHELGCPPARPRYESHRLGRPPQAVALRDPPHGKKACRSAPHDLTRWLIGALEA